MVVGFYRIVNGESLLLSDWSAVVRCKGKQGEQLLLSCLRSISRIQAQRLLLYSKFIDDCTGTTPGNDVSQRGRPDQRRRHGRRQTDPAPPLRLRLLQLTPAQPPEHDDHSRVTASPHDAADAHWTASSPRSGARPSPARSWPGPAGAGTGADVVHPLPRGLGLRVLIVGVDRVYVGLRVAVGLHILRLRSLRDVRDVRDVYAVGRAHPPKRFPGPGGAARGHEYTRLLLRLCLLPPHLVHAAAAVSSAAPRAPLARSVSLARAILLPQPGQHAYDNALDAPSSAPTATPATTPAACAGVPCGAATRETAGATRSCVGVLQHTRFGVSQPDAAKGNPSRAGEWW